MQTDSTRAKDLERHIQTRVAAELERLKAASSSKLAAASEAVSNEQFTPPSKPEPAEAPPAGLIERPLFNRIGNWLRGQDSPRLQPSRPDLDTPSLQRDIDHLKKKLSDRKQQRELDPPVAKAQQDVVKCLKQYEQRPLDCWQEIEVFKEEVRKLEKRFMESNGA